MTTLEDERVEAQSEEEAADFAEAEHIIELAEVAALCLGIAEGSLFRCGETPEQVGEFVAPIRERLEHLLNVLGCVPGDSMQLGCEDDGKKAVESFPTAPGCRACGTVTLECDCPKNAR